MNTNPKVEAREELEEGEVDERPAQPSAMEVRRRALEEKIAQVRDEQLEVAEFVAAFRVFFSGVGK